MYIGFNIKKADEMIENIVEQYNSLGVYTKEQWEPVKDTLRREWVGPDEQSFEKNFIKRLCELYVTAYELASNCTKTLGQLSDQWIEFQRKNTLDGSTALDLDTRINSFIDKFREFIAGSPRLKKDDSIIRFKSYDIDSDTNRGLQNSNSKSNIQAAVNDFVQIIKGRTEGLFNSIETNQAFFGEQSASIKKYIEATGIAIGEVLTAVKDLNDGLETLANSEYSSASSNIASAYSDAKSSIEDTSDQLGSSRWV